MTVGEEPAGDPECTRVARADPGWACVRATDSDLAGPAAEVDYGDRVRSYIECRDGALPREPRLVLCVQNDHRRAGCILQDVQQLVRVRRLSTRSGDDCLEPRNTERSCPEREALGDEVELIELARADVTEVVGVVAE